MESNPNLFMQAYRFCLRFWPVFVGIILINLAADLIFTHVANKEGLPPLAAGIAQLISMFFSFLMLLFTVLMIDRLSKGSDARFISVFDVSLQRLAEFILLQIALIFLILAGLSLFIVPGIFIFYKSIYVNYAFSSEGKGIIDSFKRSFELTSNLAPMRHLVIAPFVIMFVIFLSYYTWVIPEEPTENFKLTDAQVWVFRAIVLIVPIYFNALFYRLYSLTADAMAEGNKRQDDDSHDDESN